MMNKQNYERIMGCLAFAFFSTGITILWNIVTTILSPESGKHGFGIALSTSLGCGIILVGKKIIEGNRKVLHWAIILSFLKLIGIPLLFIVTKYFLKSTGTIKEFMFSEIDQILIWSLALYASIWLWKNKEGSEDHNQAAHTTPASAPR